MNNSKILTLVVVLSFSLTGCSKGIDPDSIMQDQISILNELIAALDKKDEDRIMSLSERFRANSEKIGGLNKQEKERLQQKYALDIMELSIKLNAAFKSHPEGAKIAESMGFRMVK